MLFYQQHNKHIEKCTPPQILNKFNTKLEQPTLRVSRYFLSPQRFRNVVSIPREPCNIAFCPCRIPAITIPCSSGSNQWFGTKLYMKLFVVHLMTQNNTLNKVHVAATELPQLLSQNTNTFGEVTAQSCCQTSCSSKVN